MRGLVDTTVPAGPGRRRWRAVRVTGAGIFVILVTSGVIVAFPAGQAPRLGEAAASIRPSTTTSVPARATTTTTPPARQGLPRHVVSTSPASGSSAISPVSNITVRFSLPLAGDSALPSLSPSVPGTWARTGPASLTFRPRAYFTPLERLILTVPLGGFSSEGEYGKFLGSTYTASFTVRGVSELRLQQLLAETGYLPLGFTRSVEPAPTGEAHQISPGTPKVAPVSLPAIDFESRHAATVALSAQPGSFSWRYPHVPAQLASLWQPGVDTALTDGAVMAFEAQHGLEDDGVPDATFWSDLLDAVAARQVFNGPYDYFEVSTALPETLSVWRDGRVIYQTPVNTGIPEAPTALGTYPVYARYLSTTMSGYNPDGSYYSDPGVPYVAYFNGGDAVHGFLRASYGFPQSLGCVELPYCAAPVVYNYDPIGTLVTVY